MRILHSILKDEKKRILLIFYIISILFVYISLCNIRVGGIVRSATSFSELNNIVETSAFEKTLLGRVLIVQFGFSQSLFAYLSVIEFPQIAIIVYTIMYLNISKNLLEKRARSYFFLLLSLLIIQYSVIGIIGVMTLRTLDVGLVFRNIQMISNIAIYGGIIHVLVVLICSYLLFDKQDVTDRLNEVEND